MNIELFFIGSGALLFVILIILMFIIVLQSPLSKPRKAIQTDLQKIKEQIVSSSRKKKQKDTVTEQVKDF